MMQMLSNSKMIKFRPFTFVACCALQKTQLWKAINGVTQCAN